jgi:hypothetical protein
MVEERHAAEAVEVTQLILRARPELLAETLRDPETIAQALDGVWTRLDRIVQQAAATALQCKRPHITLDTARAEKAPPS